MSVRFVLVYQDQRVPLRDGDVVIGRSMACQVRFNAPTVSRQHLILHIKGDGVVAENLSTSTGTLLNGRLMAAPASIQAGDTLTLGPRTFRLERVDENTGAFTSVPPPALGLLPDGDDDDITLTEDVASPGSILRGGIVMHTCPACRTQVPFERGTCPSCGHVWGAGQASIVLGQITSKNVHDDVVMPAEVIAVYSSEAMTIDVTLDEIRRDSAFVPTELLDAPGTECELTLLPEGQSPLQIRGVVTGARAQHSGKGPAGLEVKFTTMTDGVRLWIDLWARRKR